MHAIITGATSFIGLAVVKELLKAGHKVSALVRPGSDKLSKLLEHEKLSILFIDLSDIDMLPQHINTDISADEERIFIHLGWSGIGSAGRADSNIQNNNVKNSIKAINAAALIGCQRFLFAGSQAEYGIQDSLVTEKTECMPVSEYGKAKLLFGQKAMPMCKKLGMTYIHMRIFSIYGPGDHEWSLVNSCLRTFTNGEHIELSPCTQSWNFLYIEDAAEAICEMAASKKIKSGIYNIAGNDTKVLKIFVETMYEICGYKGSFHYGNGAKRAEGMASLNPDTTKIITELSWKPKTDFKTGIEMTLMEMKKKGYENATRTNCLACGQKLKSEPDFILKNAPASAQDIPDSNGIRTDKGITLRLCRCKSCGLMQLDCTPVRYYRDVIRAGGYSTTMVELRRKQYKHLIDTYKLDGKRFIEVGCGRGEFLKVLTEFPVKAYGIEHKKELVDIGIKEGLNIKCMYAEDGNTVFDDFFYDVFLSFNFLEHQPDPSGMLKAIYNNLTPEGIGLITVPSFEYIMKYDGYYELIRDHLAYYTFDTLEKLLEMNGFHILEKEMVNRDTCSVIVKKKKTKEISYECTFYDNGIDAGRLAKSFDIINKEIHDYINMLESEHKTIAIWGASHQGFTLASTTGLSERIKYIIDSAPFKQGRFAPASHIPIVSPEYFFGEPVDAILIVAPGYTDEISGIIKERYGRQVDILVLKSNHITRLDKENT